MAAPRHRQEPCLASSVAPARPLCELCRLPAVFLCPADEASLCWRCDSMVHGANFLVARHRRQFLCCICSRPTSSFTTGARIPATSHCICSRCSNIFHSSSSCPRDVVDGYGGCSPPSFGSESPRSSTGSSVLTNCGLDSDAEGPSETIPATFERSHSRRRSAEDRDDDDDDVDDDDDDVDDDNDNDDDDDVVLKGMS